MPPVWKINRELRRIGRQVAGWVPSEVPGASLWRRVSYDLSRKRVIRVTEGQRPPEERVVIQLIYQPNGLLASFLEEMQYFCAKGYCCIVVSNVPIRPADLERLKPFCHLIIERPNVGYDFGGYREGILTLRDRNIVPKHLIIKNDSVWFPIWNDCTLLDRATSSASDLFGIFENGFRDRPHLQSYFIHFGPRVTADRRFWRYWERLGLWNSKDLVIRNCEKALTGQFDAMGFDHEAMFDAASVAASIASASDDLLEELFDFHLRIQQDGGGRPKLLDLQRGEAGWRDLVIDELICGMSGHMLTISHPAVALLNLHAPILKKDRRPIYRMQRAEIFRSAADEGLRPTVRREILAWD